MYLKLKESGVAKQSIDDLIWTDEDRAEEVYNSPVPSPEDIFR